MSVDLPDLSNSMYVACLRYIQSIHEPPERRNPDTMVRRFIPLLQRWRSAWLGRDDLTQLRANPFYYYLVARTRYYDRVLQDAVSDGVRRIASVGAGSDTRAYRFERLLRAGGVGVLECDQPDVIHAKQRMVKRWGRFDYVDYLPLDLNDAGWPELERWLGEGSGPALALMEGVSPYVDADRFGRFLRFLATALPAASHVAYDFKVRGADDSFGRGGRTATPFRLSPARDEIAAYHEARGLRVERLETSAELCARLLPGLAETAAPLFSQDALVRLFTE